MDKDSNLIYENYTKINENIGLGHNVPTMVRITSIGETKPLRKKVEPPVEDETIYIQAGEPDNHGCGCDSDCRCHDNTDEDVDYDGEIDMARAELLKANEYAAKLFDHIGKKDNIEGWVASKITKASDYLSSVFHYLDYEDNIKRSEQEEDKEDAFVKPDDLEIDDLDDNPAAKKLGFE